MNSRRDKAGNPAGPPGTRNAQEQIVEQNACSRAFCSRRNSSRRAHEQISLHFPKRWRKRFYKFPVFNRRAALLKLFGCLLNPSHEKQNDKYDQDDADESDATMTIPVPIAAEAATESTEQEDYENDNEDESKRHGGLPSATYDSAARSIGAAGTL